MIKQIIAITVILTVVIIACTIQPPTKEVAVLRDITDKHFAQPNTEEISRLYDFEKGKWNSAKFRLSNISDVSYNPANEASIEAENEWLGNEFVREKKIKKFNGEVNIILGDSANEKNGKPNSSVYLPIIRELNRLSQSTAEKKVLLVYSDLMENQKELSFYDGKKLKLLETKAETIRQFLEKQQGLSDLKGIEVHFIYQPANAEADKKFRIVSNFYKNLLENKGAKVLIGAN